MGACLSTPHEKAHAAQQKSSTGESHEELAAHTHFSIDEVYALAELFKSLSSSLHQDGVINKDEFAFALFKQLHQSNIFVEKDPPQPMPAVRFADSKHNNVIEFGEFVYALSVFHPAAPLQEKAAFAFRIYDLDNTGHIERGEVQRFLAALLKDNPAIALDDAQLDAIMDATFQEADLAGDGHISPDEWQIFVRGNPHLVDYMTLPALSQLTLKYPSFMFAERPA